MDSTSASGPAEHSRVTDAVVVGAGLTGLACAHELKRRGLTVHLLEAGPRIGGVVGTFEVGGFLFESGPNTVPAGAQRVREAAGSLGVADQLITSRPEAKRRYLFMDGALREMPSSPKSLFTTPLLSRRARLRLASEPLRRFVPPAGGAIPSPEPTFEEFLTERIGGEAARTFAGAFVRGVYAAEIDELGAASAFPRMWAMAAERGGLVRGMIAKRRAARRSRKLGESAPPGPRTSATDLLSFTGGFSVLVDAYGRALEGHVSTNTAVAEIDRGPGGWRAILETGDALACRELILAVPAPAAHPLVAMCAPERMELDGLRDVRHAAVTAVHLGLEGAPLPPGFGFLVPPDEDRRRDPRTPRVLGILFISNIFHGRAPSGTTSITAMFRGGDVAALDHERLVDRAVVDLEKALMGYEAAHPDAPKRAGRPRVVASHVQRWTDVIPRYAPGHRAMAEKLERSTERMLPGLHLSGNYTGGVSVDDRIGAGLRTAERVAERLAHLADSTAAPMENRRAGGSGEAS